MHTYTPANTISDGPIAHLHSVLCILIEILIRAHAKKKKKKKKGGGGGGGGVNEFKCSNLALSLVFSVTAQQACQ